MGLKDVTCLHHERNHVIILHLRSMVELHRALYPFKNTSVFIFKINSFAKKTLDVRNVLKILKLFKFNNLITSRGRARNFIV